LAYVDLQPSAASLQVREAGFAHEAVGNDAARDANLDLAGLEFRTRGCAIAGRQLRGRSRAAKGVGIGGVSGLAKLLELLQPLLKLVLRFELHFQCPQFRGGKRGVYRPTGRTRNKPVLSYRHSGILCWLRVRNDECSLRSPQV